MNVSEHPDLQWIEQPGASPDMMQRVQTWLDAGTPLLWRPIYDRENFPDATPEMLDMCRRHSDVSWQVFSIGDLTALPAGIKGWLMPVNAEDTDVVCGRWENALTFLGCRDRRTGQPVTYRSDRADPADGEAPLRTDSQIQATPS
ncbi:hypothetical protein V4C85_20770 [Ralstonia solanacearum]|uniref:hypothetical protein n=1 Tax=Ralstonia solanacearum TaxID=305 RepID=UPI0007C93BF6|nr:hypothetical protein [Ralstonia solanacearum]OAI79031.1 hypothetical protein RSP597_00895 [Ralstonia solanacearum]